MFWKAGFEHNNNLWDRWQSCWCVCWQCAMVQANALLDFIIKDVVFNLPFFRQDMQMSYRDEYNSHWGGETIKVIIKLHQVYPGEIYIIWLH